MRRFTAVVPIAIAAMLATAACGNDDGDNQAADDGPVTLTVATFGEFGYKELYADYQKLHPNVKITERITKTEDHHKNLAAHLATNTGAADIEALEEGWIGQFTANASKFNDLNELGAGDVKAQWPEWKWNTASSKDGKTIGLGTDVGGMAMCYRRDLFEKAGLPTDRAEVSKLWPTWEQYIETGKKFEEAKVPGAHFFDGPTVMYRSILGQAPTGLYDGDNVVVDSNPEVKKAFDLSALAVTSGLSARAEAWTPAWNAGFAKGTFATLGCPSWMMAYIQTQAKDASGKWDIADVPGGGGNWGGSWLTVPKQSKHAKQAYELAKWLTAPEQQAKVFQKYGNFPSTVTLYEDPVIKDFVNPYFNNAPVGQIFSKSVQTMKPQYLGPKAGDINTQIINGLTRIEQGKQTPEQSWQQVLTDVKALL